ncbi:hypothetical protein MBSD_n1509 [Mizugakiibacter sediminis]|uniref:Secreted protein n=1 Tax=Mizugakiibacter sediminis TaxID=1475481 RepID=A0A0K8QND0_9GAMM|nr:hypothetical protein [Mizugakiibacter sediminis]GAP66206.1 hypothetical protein MBSD_n1509 [Mizugakiibacter sediminis]
MRTLSMLAAAVLACGIALLPSAPARAGDVTCKMTFTLSGWSAFYKTYSGSGHVTCSNGQSANVRIRSKGGGLTFGKSTIHGKGEFTGVGSIGDIYGAYANANAHAGAAKSAGATVVTKGSVSLALAGKGEGWDIGIDFGKFVIER